MLSRLLNLVGLQRRDYGLTDPALLALFGGTPTAAGVAVTAATALRSPTALAAVRVLAESLSALPVHLFERGDDGSRTRNTTHPAALLLSGDWAPWAGGTDIRTQLQFDVLLHGQAFALVVRAGGSPKEIHRLCPGKTVLDTSGPEPKFKATINGVQEVYDWRDVLYLTTPGAAFDRPLCLIHEMREAIGLDLIMAEHQARIFSGGARPSGVLKAGKGKLAPEKLAFLRDSFNQNYGGAHGSGKTLILEDEWDFKATQFSSVDLQFLELRKQAAADILAGFKIPPALAGNFEKATWSNAEQMNRQFLQLTLLPWIEQWTGALSRVLLTPEERSTMFAEFIVDDLLRADISGRFTAYRAATGGAWLTPNEARQRENLPPIEGGDKLIMQAGQGAPGDPAPDSLPFPKPKAVA